MELSTVSNFIIWANGTLEWSTTNYRLKLIPEPDTSVHLVPEAQIMESCGQLMLKKLMPRFSFDNNCDYYLKSNDHHTFHLNYFIMDRSLFLIWSILIVVLNPRC